MKSVLVTGGTTRLGLAIAEHLRAAGWRVLTTSHRSDAGADIVADFTLPDGARRAFETACAALGGEVPAALVNNAALFTGTESDLDAVNRHAPETLTALMAQRRMERGCVVNILDARAREGFYGVTKRALREQTLRDAVAFAATLRVNGVAPGPVMAPVGAHEKAGPILIDRPTPRDVAEAILFLLEAQATTGLVIPVDGGQHLL